MDATEITIQVVGVETSGSVIVTSPFNTSRYRSERGRAGAIRGGALSVSRVPAHRGGVAAVDHTATVSCQYGST